jgi:3-hydroxyisobutyrate dehydrogenase-like beta-hydroxyacid dehydrogenase
MDVTIIGTGNMARGIAPWLLAGGHGITLLGTETGKAEDLAGECGFLVMALRQPLGLNFRSAWKFVG